MAEFLIAMGEAYRQKHGPPERRALARIREILSGERSTAEKIDEFTRLILTIEPDTGIADNFELLEVLGMGIPQEFQEMNDAFDAMTEEQKKELAELREEFQKKMADLLEAAGASESLLKWFTTQPATPMWRP